MTAFYHDGRHLDRAIVGVSNHSGVTIMTTVAATILPHLPYLRRFARSLTGRQASGDAYVAALLEALVADPGTFPSDVPPKIALYQLFLRHWNSVGINSEPTPIGGVGQTSVADERIESITPLPRQAFLLTAVEGFQPADAARVLGLDQRRFEQLLDTASREIAEQVATEILIIEDEPLIAWDLETIVVSIGHKVRRVARTQKEAVAAFKATNPGLILADIQLADGSSGLDAVNEILGDTEVPVIFITAYPEKVLTGRRPEPTFLISKPFLHETVKAVVSQALFFNLKAHRRTQR